MLSFDDLCPPTVSKHHLNKGHHHITALHDAQGIFRFYKVKFALEVVFIYLFIFHSAPPTLIGNLIIHATISTKKLFNKPLYEAIL